MQSWKMDVKAHLIFLLLTVSIEASNSGLEHIACEDAQWGSQAVDCTGVRKAVKAGVVGQQIIGRLEFRLMKRTGERSYGFQAHCTTAYFPYSTDKGVERATRTGVLLKPGSGLGGECLLDGQPARVRDRNTNGCSDAEKLGFCIGFTVFLLLIFGVIFRSSLARFFNLTNTNSNHLDLGISSLKFNHYHYTLLLGARPVLILSVHIVAVAIIIL